MGFQGGGFNPACRRSILALVPPLSPSQLGAQLDTLEVAAITKTCVHTVRGWIRAGELTATRLSSGPKARYRVDPADLQAFLLSRRTA